MGINVPGSGGGRQLRPPPPPPVRRGSPPTTGAGVIADRPMHGFSGAPQRQQVRQSVIDTRRANASVVQRAASNVGHAVSQSVRQTVGHVFDHQNPAQQAAILRGALRSSSPYAQAVLDHVTTNLRSSFAGGSVYSLKAPKGQGEGSVFGIPVSHLTTPQSHQFAFGTGSRGGLGKALGDVGRFAQGLLTPHQTDLQRLANKTGAAATPQKALEQAGKIAAKGIQQIPIAHYNTPGEQIASAGGMPPGQLVKNALKDAVNLPAEVGPSVAVPVGQALQGHWHQALAAVTQPYIQAIHHPLQALSEHPLNTYLMFAGPGHAVTRIIESGGRAALGKGPVERVPPSVALTANLTHERPAHSPHPVTRLSQRTIASQLYTRNAEGHLVPSSDLIRQRLTRLETSRLVGQNERVRTTHRDQQIQAHQQTVLTPKAQRAVHSVTTALKYNPKPALIPGADVLARIVDGTIRKPSTVEQDLQKHLQQVTANRSNLTGMPEMLKEHDAYVRELQAALADKKFLKNPLPAFKAASRYAKDYKQLEGHAQALGHFRDMSKDALTRRTLMPTVIAHMPGARMDPEAGMVVDIPKAGGGVTTHALSTPEMAKFAREQVGRDLAYTSHQPRYGDRAFYVSGQRRPLPAQMGNTLFAYTHGLTVPGHEALLEQRVRMQGIVDAHRAMNRLDNQLVNLQPNGKGWATYKGAARDAAPGYVPIRLAQQFHPSESLSKALRDVSMSTLDEEAARRSLDINSRLQPSSEPGSYGLIHQDAADQLRAHEALISPDRFFRGLRGMTNQFRRVALGTSFRHLPGVAQEIAIRSAASGVGPISLLAGRAVLKRAQELDARVGEERAIQLRGGTAAGQALAMQTRQVSRHFTGTLLEPPLRAWEKFMQAPGARQAGNAWRSYIKFVLQGTKHVLEQNAQTAAIGKMTIRDFGGNHGVLAKAMGTWGQMVDQAAKGVLDENKARQFRAEINRVYGRWTDLTPGEQRFLMFSPFGMWWTNSVAWLSRFPVDHKIATSALASLSSGTEAQRQKLGLDMFAPGHLPLYLQGSIPVGGGKVWEWNYYSPVGTINNPMETAGSLIAPWQSSLLYASAGANAFGKEMTSPQNPRGGPTNPGTRIGVIMNSLAASFIPLYSKAQTIVEGGATRYDTSTLPRPQTKGQGSLGAGLRKATMPIRVGKLPASAGQNAAFGGSPNLPTVPNVSLPDLPTVNLPTVPAQ